MAEPRNSNTTRTALAVGAAAIAAGAATLFFRRNEDDRDGIDSDAPHWTLDKDRQGDRPVVGKTILVNRPRQALFDTWSKFERFPDFMENVRAVRIEGGRSIWEIEAPGGKTVTLRNRITNVEPGREISWQSDEDSDIANSGKVSFEDAPAGRGTYVSLVMSYEPPGGTIGRGIAKLFQREPAVQARRDLRRFKQLMETGELTVNASPSSRKSESPTEPHI